MLQVVDNRKQIVPSKRKTAPIVPDPMENFETLETTFRRDIRPILDVVDKIRSLGVTEENIQLPTIVVVGDQSSGKSSVLESLAGITLPRGQGIATRVPLILRLQSCESEDDSLISMDYGIVKGRIITGEDEIEAAINIATDELAGNNKNVKDTPISLLIRKPNAPDLTMVDLPGITRVPIHGQPLDIYEQISSMIMERIRPEESIILNVLSAQVDFPTCESIRMSQQVDKQGKRTLAVVTKVDKAPEGLFEKVTTDAVNIGLGYICVRNRTDSDDSIEVARVREKNLFDTHPALKKMDSRMMGIPALAQKLTEIQAQMVKSCLPKIFKQMRDALHSRQEELKKLPAVFVDDVNVHLVILRMQERKHKALAQLVRDGDINMYPDTRLHYTARLHEMFVKFSNDLHQSGWKLMDESQTEKIEKLLLEYQGVTLPNFLPHRVLEHLVEEQIDSVGGLCRILVEDTYEYATKVVSRVNADHSVSYPVMEKLYEQLAADELEVSKNQSLEFVERMLKKEKTVIFTTNHYYSSSLEKMRTLLATAKESNSYGEASLELGEGVEIPLSELHCKGDGYYKAWTMKASVAAYWKVVKKRIADEIPLELIFALQCTIVDTLQDSFMKMVLETKRPADLIREDPHVIQNRGRLQRRVNILQECLNLVSQFMR